MYHLTRNSQLVLQVFLSVFVCFPSRFKWHVASGEVVTALAAITASGTSCQLQLKSCNSYPTPPSLSHLPQRVADIETNSQSCKLQKKEEKKERKWRMTHSSKLQWKIRKFNEGMRERNQSKRILSHCHQQNKQI